jgi:hypothetical protein
MSSALRFIDSFVLSRRQGEPQPTRLCGCGCMGAAALPAPVACLIYAHLCGSSRNMHVRQHRCATASV